jgi:hypothetical protein
MPAHKLEQLEFRKLALQAEGCTLCPEMCEQDYQVVASAIESL